MKYRAELPFRGKMVELEIPLDAAGKTRMEELLARLSEEGYSAVVWLGPNELWPPANHRLIRHQEFPEARELSDDEIERNIAEMQWLLGQAKLRGMQNFLYTLSVVYTSAFGEAHGE